MVDDDDDYNNDDNDGRRTMGILKAFLPADRGKITLYGSNFQQVNLTPNGGVSPTGYHLCKLGRAGVPDATCQVSDRRILVLEK